MNNNRFFLICVLFLVFIPFSTRSEFYEYVDGNGVKTFTDEQGGIPESQMDDVQVHKEPYDDLPEEERQRMIEADAVRLEEINRLKSEEWEKYQQEKRLRELEKEKANKQKAPEKETTPVFITRNNRILVPVSLGYRGKTLQAKLLLDTGANMTVIHDDVAEHLGVKGGRSGYVIVAGGAKVKIQQVPVKFVKVGPKTVSNLRISVLPHKGQDKSFGGLLGMDFLRQFKYTIDYEKSVVVWNE